MAYFRFSERHYPPKIPSHAEDERCLPNTNIVLAKTHKTGGSTLSTIIARFGYERNLSFALPANGYILGYSLFSKEMLLKQPSMNGFSILVNHVPFNKKEMEKVMNVDAKYVTILRDPVSRWYSAVAYYSLWTLLLTKEQQKSKDFGTDFPKELPSSIAECDEFACRLGYNGQLFDLGMTFKSDMKSKTAIERKIIEVEEDFDLVLIAEYFDESLLLLRKMMCWTFDDIVYIKKKQRFGVNRENPPDKKMADEIRKWNEGDVMLYEKFNRTLWKKVHKYGPNFERDLRYFREMNNAITKSCVNISSFNEQGNHILLNSSVLCENLNRDIRPYTKMLVQQVKKENIISTTR